LLEARRIRSKVTIGSCTGRAVDEATLPGERKQSRDFLSENTLLPILADVSDFAHATL
jgi:hypothetical protein